RRTRGAARRSREQSPGQRRHARARLDADRRAVLSGTPQCRSPALESAHWPHRRPAAIPLTSRRGFGVLLSEVLLSLIRVVCTATQLNVVDRRLSTRCERHDVVHLEKSARSASTMTTDECAARTVAFPHCALDMRRNAARASADLDRK